MGSSDRKVVFLADVIEEGDCKHTQGMAKSIYVDGFYCVVCGVTLHQVVV